MKTQTMLNLRLNPGSISKLEECDKRLQAILKTAAQTEAFLVLCGFRNQAEQDKVFSEGKSKVKWPNGMHNQYPSKAVDLAPIPLDWSDKDAFYRLGGKIMAIAQQLGVRIRWGATFDTLKDLGHFELVEEPEIIKESDKPETISSSELIA